MNTIKKLVKSHDYQKSYQTRKKLQRFSSLLQDAWRTFCRKTQNYDIKRVIRQPDGRLLVVKQSIFLPHTFKTDRPRASEIEEEQLAIDTYLTCTTASFCNAELIRAISGESDIIIEEVAVSPKNPRITVVTCSDCDDGSLLIEDNMVDFGDGYIGFKRERHVVLKITLQNKSQSALDISAAQYGHKEVLLPWKEYCSKRVKFIRGVPDPAPAPSWEESTKEWFGDGEREQYRLLVVAYVEVVKEWCRGHELGERILELSDIEFESAKDSLLLAIRTRLDAVIEGFSEHT